MITKGQLEELHDGDIVELIRSNTPASSGWAGDTFRGPVRLTSRGAVCFGTAILRWADGELSGFCGSFDLRIVERVPPPLYVNHGRTHPEPGDVARGPQEPGSEPGTWTYTFGGWVSTRSGNWLCPVPRPARLLVDGETGQIVR